MNYIKKLQSDNDAMKQDAAAVASQISEFRAFLTSAKFVGTESDGSRKDWISTGDVDRFLSLLLEDIGDRRRQYEGGR